MKPEFMLAYFTTAPTGPAEALLIAQKVGYVAIGVRLAALSQGGDFAPLCESPRLLHETLARMNDTGVSVFDIEGVRLEQFQVGKYDRLLATAAQLRAKVLSAISFDPDEQRTTESFAALCDAAAVYQLDVSLEFIPYSTVPDAASALRILQQAQRPNARMAIDFLHAHWSGMTRTDLEAIPQGWLSYAQLCDAPVERPTTREGLIHVARHARLLPGEGAIEISSRVQELPAHLPLSIEVPDVEQLAVLGAEEWARSAWWATRRALEKQRSDTCR